tara:strand:- start:835 stop:1647 length:813 start_codon:yes stop_codon:yes gene_type:complete
MSKILILTGDHPRHLYFAKQIILNFQETTHFIQKREAHLPLENNQIGNHLQQLQKMHFEKRKLHENNWFGDGLVNDEIAIDQIIEGVSLKDDSLYTKFKSINPDVVLVYGTGLLGPKISSIGKLGCFNFHGGLSPWYKGAATHFWPSYFLEPQFTGVTIHRIIDKIDAGEILHQSTPELVETDTIHELSCRAVNTAIEELIMVVKNILSSKKVQTIPQRKNGKLFLKKDWKPHHLKIIYETFGDQIVKYCLENNKIEYPDLYQENWRRRN